MALLTLFRLQQFSRPPFQVTLPRTMATATLTAQQIQQLAASSARGGQAVLPSAISALRPANPVGAAGARTQVITRPAGQTMLRPQHQAAALQGQAVRQAGGGIAIQRPVGAAAAGTQAAPIAVAVANNRPGGVQQQQRTVVAPAGTAAAAGGPRQQIVVASSGQGGLTRQIVMANPGGNAVRQGHILQVTQGGQQHIVVSQSGQIILGNPPGSKTSN